jgi:hypothetical protein
MFFMLQRWDALQVQWHRKCTKDPTTTIQVQAQGTMRTYVECERLYYVPATPTSRV